MEWEDNPKPFLRASDFYVSDVPLADAQRLVRDHHYSRGGSNTACYTHGLFSAHDGQLFGVAWWLPPTRVAAESVNKANWTKVIALTRLVCIPEAPKNSASFLLGRSIQLIRKDGRFMSLVTYADERMGHTGQIYKATNWTYVGRTGPYPAWQDPKTGRQVATLATKTRTKEQMEGLGYVMVGRFHKHKFVLHLVKP